MRKSLILAAGTGLLLTSGASAAYADTVTTDFEGMDPGSVNGQEGWLAHRPIRPGGPRERGHRLRHPVTQGLLVLASGSFGDCRFSSTPAAPASEITNQGFASEFSFKALGAQVNRPRICRSAPTTARVLA